MKTKYFTNSVITLGNDEFSEIFVNTFNNLSFVLGNPLGNFGKFFSRNFVVKSDHVLFDSRFSGNGGSRCVFGFFSESEH